MRTADRGNLRNPLTVGLDFCARNLGRPILSDEGVRRRHRILQIAVKEGERQRKRRRVKRIAGICSILGFVLVAVITLNPADRSEEHNRIAANDRHPVSPNTQLLDEPFTAFQFSVVSSNIISIDKYIVRTSEVRQPVTFLDEDELVESLRDTRLGVAQIGNRCWLTCGDGTLVSLN